MLIDTHCHLTDLEDLQVINLLENAKNADIRKCICIGASNGEASNKRAFDLSNSFEDIFASIGIHPQEASSSLFSDKIIELAASKKVVAIGETGLDFFRDTSDFKDQESVFRKSIQIAKDLSKPLIIHCRDALEETLKILREEKADIVGGVFHCYSGTAETAKILNDINFYVSYTGILTFKSSTRVREEAKKIPLSQIILETDAPYMAPEPYRGGQSEPAHVLQIAKKLAEVKEVSLEEIKTITTNNAHTLFKNLQ